MANRIKLNLSREQVEFIPDDFKDFSRRLPKDGQDDFVVTVVNTSNEFASFHIELYPQGSVGAEVNTQWYQAAPNISAKIQPGAKTTFHITLLKSPVPRCNITVPVTVKVVSVEMEDLQAEVPMQLRLGQPNAPIQVHLLTPGLQVYPGKRLPIPVQVQNLGETPKSLKLKLSGLDPDWLPQGAKKDLRIASADTVKLEFMLAPPATNEAICKDYKFTVTALISETDNATNADFSDSDGSDSGTITVLPYGNLEQDCERSTQWIPSRQGWRLRNRLDTAIFMLQLTNRSNLSLQVDVDVPIEEVASSLAITPVDSEKLAPGTSHDWPVEVTVKRPWIGITRTQFLRTHPRLIHAEAGQPVEREGMKAGVGVSPTTQTLTLKIRPVMPLLLQVGGLGLVGFLLWLLWLFNPQPRHSAPVNALTLMSNGETVISGSSDTTLRRWQVRRDWWRPDVRKLRFTEELQTGPTAGDAAIDRAVRTLTPLPSGLEQVAVGLENGDIQVWAIDPAQQSPPFDSSEPDRVFALDFTADSEMLFSGHGSGTVRRRDLSNMVLYELKLGDSYSFAITSLRVVPLGGGQSLAAIGGQFNRLVLWNWQQPSEQAEVFSVSPLPADTQEESERGFAPVVSRNSYLSDLAVAARTPDQGALLASADNRGMVQIWDVNQLWTCATEAEPVAAPTTTDSESNEDASHPISQTHVVDDETCLNNARLDHWQATEAGYALRSLALTKNGCYLATVGDDGAVNLWQLNQEGKHDPAPITLKRYRGGLNAVDIYFSRQRATSRVLVASDTPNHQVRLYTHRVEDNGCQ